jgi:hypothetical protein
MNHAVPRFGQILLEKLPNGAIFVRFKKPFVWP